MKLYHKRLTLVVHIDSVDRIMNHRVCLCSRIWLRLWTNKGYKLFGWVLVTTVALPLPVDSGAEPCATPTEHSIALFQRHFKLYLCVHIHVHCIDMYVNVMSICPYNIILTKYISTFHYLSLRFEKRAITN